MNIEHSEHSEPAVHTPQASPAAERRALLAGIGGLAAGALLVGAKTAHAGPLNPPPGPVTGTPGPEPRIPINSTNTPGTATAIFNINQPGSYYLTGNVQGAPGRNGIAINASGVTIDLNGFTLTGGSGSLNGIISVAASRIIVRNGTVTGWGGSGIDLSLAESTLVESVAAHTNGAHGVRSGAFSVVRCCAAARNAESGITGFASSVVEACQSSFNTGPGISTGSGSVISRCAARNNAGVGLSVSSNCLVSESVAANNQTGISAGNASSVIHCSASDNAQSGIAATSACLILENCCRANGTPGSGAAGIRIVGSDNRIEGNNSNLGDRGIDVIAQGNFIVRNTCSGNNTDWSIAANNMYGPIIDRRIPLPVPNTPAVAGTAANSTLGSTDPFANFTF